MERTEFGFPRTKCACNVCRKNCRFMPGFLIPSDLERMVPEGDPFAWAVENLLASPGALVLKGYETFRIPTLVPAVKADGSCIHFDKGRCHIHRIAPFGCAFFDCGPERGNLSRHGLVAVMKAWETECLYTVLWNHLYALGKVQQSANILRQRMRETV